MEIKQHRPNYFSGFDTEIVKFDTVDELKEIGFVKNFSDNLDGKFHQYSLSEYYTEDTHLLMAEYNKGKTWWVVGYIKGKDIDSIVGKLPKHE